MASLQPPDIESVRVSDEEFAELTEVLAAAEASCRTESRPICFDFALQTSANYFSVRARPAMPVVLRAALRAISVCTDSASLVFPIAKLRDVSTLIARHVPAAVVNRIPEPVLKVGESLERRRSLAPLHVCASMVKTVLGDDLWQKLLPFQREGIVCAAKSGGRILLADEMGLGKTVSALALAQFLRFTHSPLPLDSLNINDGCDPGDNNGGPVLILCSSTLRKHWTDAISRWLPNVPAFCVASITCAREATRLFQAQQRRKRDLWDSSPRLQFVVCSYDLFSRLRVLSRRGYTTDYESCPDVSTAVCRETYDSSVPTMESNIPPFRVIIADECHYLKNPFSARTRACLPVITASEFRILLSGTPMTSRPLELFTVLTALLEEPRINQKFMSFEFYADRYCGGSDANGRGATNLGELHAMLTSVMIRRTKADISLPMPVKIRGQCLLHLSDSRLRKFEEMFQEMHSLRQLIGNGSSDSVASDDAGLRIQLLYTTMYAVTASAKIPGILTRLHELTQSDDGIRENLLLFAFHRDVLDAAENLLRRIGTLFVRVDGSTPAVCRSSLVEQFQTNEDVKVALLSINVAGTGLNLSKADRILFAELDWVPSNILQAEDRAHRLGRTRPLFIEYIVARGTLDDCMWSALRTKFVTINTAVDGISRNGSALDNMQFHTELTADETLIQTLCFSDI